MPPRQPRTQTTATTPRFPSAHEQPPTGGQFLADLLEAHKLGTGLGYGGQLFSAAEVDLILSTDGGSSSDSGSSGVTSGAGDDYAFSRHFVSAAQGQVYGFTIECGQTFQRP